MPDVQAFFKNLSAASLQTLIETVLTLVVGYVLIKIAMRMIKHLFAKTKLDGVIQKLLMDILRAVMYFVLLTMCMGKLGIPPTSLITLLGVFGLAISLAMQDSLANFAGGISVVASKPFKQGDYIELGAVQGTVRSIGFIHTTLQTADNKRIFVPNSQMSKEKIINCTAEPQRRLEITLLISYKDDVEAARNIILGELARDARILKNQEPFVKVWQLLPATVEIMVRAWVMGDDLLEAKCDLLERIKTALQQNGFGTPYNTL